MFKLYCIRDTKSGQWQAPVPDHNDATMRRGLAAGLTEHDLRSFAPSDFEVYNVGTFDPESGLINSCVPEYVCCVADIVREELSHETKI